MSVDEVGSLLLQGFPFLIKFVRIQCFFNYYFLPLSLFLLAALPVPTK